VRIFAFSSALNGATGSRLRVVVGIFFIVQSLYLLSASGHLRGQDQEYFYRMARSLARERTFAIEPLVLGEAELAGVRGRDGRFYSRYAPGLPAALAPIVLLGDALTKLSTQLPSKYEWPHQSDSDIAPRILVSYFNLPVTALSASILALIVMRLGQSALSAIITGFGFALTTFAWGQARLVFAEPLQALVLLAACALLLNAKPSRSLLGGCALGFAILVKMTSLLALPAFLLLPDERGRLLCRSRSATAGILVPVAGALALYAWYNWFRFGSLMATGYAASDESLDFTGNPLTALSGFLLSPGRGVFWYAPLTAVALFAIRRFYSEQKIVARAFLVLIGAWFVIHLFYKRWDAGWGWGPRYLLPILPFLLVPMPLLWRSAKWRSFCVVALIIGAAIELPGILADFIVSGWEGLRVFQQHCSDCSEQSFVAWRNFTLSGSEIVRNSIVVIGGKVDLALVTFSGTWLPAATISFAALFALTGFAILAWPRSRESEGASWNDR
jgi:hypothetical protein